MCNRLYYYFEKIISFYRKQFGFHKKNSCIDALAELTERQRHQKNNASTNFFLDLKKLFDTLDHEILLKKLLRSGIRGNTIKWFRCYLSNRVQKVELQGYTSDWREASCLVPQGSVLGPLLFPVYINDLPLCTDSIAVFLFVDDTNLCGLELTPNNIANDLNSVSNWLNANKIVLNENKTVCMNIGNSASNNVLFYLNNCIVQCEPVCKYLGIMLDSKLSFVYHVDYVMKRSAVL